jgi:cytoskeleton protein RodZ
MGSTSRHEDFVASRNHMRDEDFYTDLPVGEILRRGRLQYGMSIPEVEHALRIRREHLNALENSNFAALPGRAYVIGFVRTYAEFLNLDGGRVVELLKKQAREGLGSEAQAMNFQISASESRVPSVPIVGVAITMLALLLVIWVAYQNMRLSGVDEFPAVPEDLQSLQAFEKNTEESIAPSADNEEPQGPLIPAEKPVEAVPDVASVPEVEIKLLDDSWIELRNPEGRVVDARLFRKGEVIALDKPVDEFGNTYAITMGNAGGVEIRVGGKSLGTLGETNKVRRNVPLNPKTLKLLMAN